MENPFKRKPTLTISQTRGIIRKLELDEESVFGKEIWPCIKPRNYHQGQHRTHFKDIEIKIYPIKEGGVELKVSGVFVDLPYQAKKSYKIPFNYKKQYNEDTLNNYNFSSTQLL